MARVEAAFIGGTLSTASGKLRRGTLVVPGEAEWTIEG
ncbi:hypothetical protein THTE_0062 [Thermogutta terrifontis]|uniref:Uncharacterized protein n=1 Tax=Thermogutta terrifontis TaxID=1331910 RepID=A0A286R9M4_9BACT|nr:hypothetical protein THTE_0062 [Thermogutta terrifontis]